MRRPFVIPTVSLALALVPAVLFAQAPPGSRRRRSRRRRSSPPRSRQRGQQPPAGQTAAQTCRAQADVQTPAGMLLVQVKPDQSAAFEEMIEQTQDGNGP